MKLISWLSMFILLASLNGCDKTQKLPTGAIPFNYDGNLIIQANINDSISGRFIIDTGADGLILDSTFLAKNELLNGTFHVAHICGVGKKSIRKVTILHTPFYFTSGIFEGESKNTAVLDLKGIIAKNIDGIMGFQFFQKKIIEINYDKQYIRRILYSNFKPSKNMDVVDLKILNNRPFISIDLQIDDTMSVREDFMIDLGSASSLLFNSHWQSKLSMVNDQTPYKKLIGGISGESEGFDFRCQNLTIGNTIFNDATVSYSTDKEGSLAKLSRAGLIGNKILSRTNLTLNFITKKLYLEKNKHFNAPFRVNTFGFTPNFHDSIENYPIVVCLWPNSNAAKNGLKLGDSIITINKKSIFKYTRQELLDLSERINAPISLVVKNQTGLKDYIYTIKDLL